MNDEEWLLQRIENYRTKMNRLCKVKPLFSREVVQASQTLDDLLNQYDIIKKKNCVH